MKFPLTHDNWEWGYFTQNQLEKAGAYRTDAEIGDDEDVFPDGGEIVPGRGRATLYYWMDPETGGALYHTEAYDDEAAPFFPSTDEAVRFFEQQAEQIDEDRYERMSLYKARVTKDMDALDVLMDQSGLSDFSNMLSED